MDEHQLEVDLDDDLLINEFTHDFFAQATSDEGAETVPTPEHLEVLQKCFGHHRFRPLQWKIINTIINFKRDNCAIMATGYGKSLCFQYPSAYVGGLTLVISPLISLMEDQVLSLKMSNVPACLLGTAQKNQKQVIQDILEDKYSIVYLTPEFCTGECGKELLTNIYETLSVTLIAIDEAHCVSSWGHDFRHSYRSLGILKSILPGVPILAVTATATPKVKDDIISVLKLRNPQVVYSGFDRPNLFFAVKFKQLGLFEDLKSLMVRDGQGWRFSGPTIIYCITRKATEEVSNVLSACDMKCLPYHAGLALSVRKDAHEKFVKDKIQVIVATIAFGMGIDKPDIRNVIHYGCPGSIESYYQEVGRAGRDGRPSNCVTFYNNVDILMQKKLHELPPCTASQKQRKSEMLNDMINYLNSRECRRKFILSYFEDKNSRCNIPYANCCDNCIRMKESPADTDIYEGLDQNGMYDFTKHAVTFLSAVNAMDGKYGIGTYASFLSGSKKRKIFDKYQKNALHGSGKHQSDEWWKAIGSLMENQKFLADNKSNFGGRFNYSTYRVSKKGNEFCEKAQYGTAKLVTVPTPDIFRLLKKKPQQKSEWLSVGATPACPSTTPTNLQPSTSQTSTIKFLGAGVEDKALEAKLLRFLRNRRHELSVKHDCMPYMVASDTALMGMAKHKPINLTQLRDIKADGFTEAKLSKFGIEFIDVIKNVCKIKETQEGRKRSIQDVLIQNPIGKFSMSAQVSYVLFRKGRTIQEIAKERNSTPDTIMLHLTNAMLVGYPIKIRDFGITDKTRDTIINVINEMEDNSTLSLLKIRGACPDDISYFQLKPVVTYLRVRSHLKDLGIPYEEFEDFEYNVTEEDDHQMKSQTETNTIDVGKQDISLLLDACAELNDSDDDLLMAVCDRLERGVDENSKNSGYSDDGNLNRQDEDSDSTIVLDDEDLTGPPFKKIKNHESVNIFSVLDSPPRDNVPIDFESEKNKSKPENTIVIENKAVQNSLSSEKTLQSSRQTSKMKKKLPSWLSTKK